MWSGTLCRLWQRFDSFGDKADVDNMVMFDHIFNFIDLLYIYLIFICMSKGNIVYDRGRNGYKREKSVHNWLKVEYKYVAFIGR